jgi:hypothetical protein
MILRIIIKVKINILFTSLLPVLIFLVPTTLKRILVKVPILLKIKMLIILPIIILI